MSLTVFPRLPFVANAKVEVMVTDYVRLRVIPLELSEANQVVSVWHRHHKPCQGHRFSIGVVDASGRVRGACIVGRPVARLAGHPKQVLEVTRLVTDGTKNVCSMLYGAAARVGRELGYLRIQTYILAAEETGVSLKASGWEYEGATRGGPWIHTDGRPRRTDQPMGAKTRWSRKLGQAHNETIVLPTYLAPLNDNRFDSSPLGLLVRRVLKIA